VDQSATTNGSRGQAARLSAVPALADQAEEVEVTAAGRCCVRGSESWDNWLESQSVSNDFLSVREQPSDQERVSFDARTSLSRG
jgi:antitoxin VapB